VYVAEIIWCLLKRSATSLLHGVKVDAETLFVVRVDAGILILCTMIIIEASLNQLWSFEVSNLDSGYNLVCIESYTNTDKVLEG